MKIDMQKTETSKKIILELMAYPVNEGLEILAQIFIKMCICAKLDKGYFIEATSNLYDELEEQANLIGELK